MIYLLIVLFVNVDDSIGLEPCASVPETSVDDSNRPEIRVVIVNLVDGVGPAVADSNTSHLELKSLIGQ